VRSTVREGGNAPFYKGRAKYGGMPIHAVFDALMQQPPIAAMVREMVRQVTFGEGAMTDARALEEVSAAKRILQRHYDAGFLLGIFYRYADGPYAELAERQSAEIRAIQMTVEPGILDDGALLLVVKTDDCLTHEDFWHGGGLRLAVQGIHNAIDRGEMPDPKVARVFQSDGRGCDVEIELRRSNGTLIKSDGAPVHWFCSRGVAEPAKTKMVASTGC
jgi:hypothetical protein